VAVVVCALVGVAVGCLGACVNLAYPAGASKDGGVTFMPHTQNGAPCLQNGDCRSGFCADGFCCSEKCDAICMTCSKPGNQGRCVVADEGTNPHASCTDQKPQSCGTNGVCDGNGACEKYPVGTPCSEQTCQVLNVTSASRCTADGQCLGGVAQSCQPYLCEEGKTSCRTSCMQDTDCASPSQCLNGLCGGAKARGVTCNAGTECASGFCAQGVCCSEACTDLCKSCALKGSEGACTLVPAGMPAPAPTMLVGDAGTPPTVSPTCAKTDPSTCGTDGTCDGSGACRLYVAGTACSAGSCTSATLHPASTCDGKMHCLALNVISCGGYTCADAATCKTTCMADTDCASPSVCGQGACGGLAAQYFRQTNLTDLAFTRTDPQINFNWGTGSPSPLLNVDNFSIRWRGKITARFNEVYTFYAATDDGERLIIGGKTLIDHFVKKPSVPDDIATLMMTAGQPVDFEFQYFENGGDASAVLSWSSKSEGPKAVIPTTAFAPQ
jgi:hypothetical protein